MDQRGSPCFGSLDLLSGSYDSKVNPIGVLDAEKLAERVLLYVTSMSGAYHYIECVTPIGTHLRPPAYTHTAKKVPQPSAMLRNSEVAKIAGKFQKLIVFFSYFSSFVSCH